jgi:acyl homoserine lactone synthase
LWESTRFCVDTRRLGRGRDRNSVSYATCELMIASLEAAKRAGVSDIVTVIDPVMDRVLKRSGNAPYDYVGKVADMGKVPALAALLDCTEERINRIRDFGGVEGDVFISDEAALALPAIARAAAPKTPLEQYCDEQIASATSEKERVAALRLKAALEDKIRSRMDLRA